VISDGLAESDHIKRRPQSQKAGNLKIKGWSHKFKTFYFWAEVMKFSIIAM
jgi:hypothetical protein